MIIEPAPTTEEAAAIAAALAQLGADMMLRDYKSKWCHTELKLRGYDELGDWKKTARREAVDS